MFIMVDKNGNNITDKIGKLTRCECFNIGIDPDWNPLFLKEGEWYKTIVTKKEEEKVITYLDEIEKRLYEQALREISLERYSEAALLLDCLKAIKYLKEEKIWNGI